jgi:hypothetical protein
MPRIYENAPTVASQRVANFARFFCIWKRLGIPGDTEELRHQLVSQYTNGRTESLREMQLYEYNALCYDLEHGRAINREELRQLRHLCLKLMEDAGVDTDDWRRINAFCQDKRIAGESFYRLNEGGLTALSRKLRAIIRKGGLKVQPVVSGGQVIRLHIMVEGKEMSYC